MNKELQILLQDWYLTCRKLHASGVFSQGSVQLSFDVLSFSVLKNDAWRPTHASMNAIKCILNNDIKSVQRAHGALLGRLDRHERTRMILGGPEQTFDKWWSFALEHDKTVLVTKEEHGSRVIFKEEDLVRLPDWSEGMFDCPGKSTRFRKSLEVKWLQENFGEKT